MLGAYQKPYLLSMNIFQTESRLPVFCKINSSYPGRLATCGGSPRLFVGGVCGSPRAATYTSHPLACELPEAVRKPKET